MRVILPYVTLCLATVLHAADQEAVPQRQLAVDVTVKVLAEAIAKGEPIPIAVTIHNRLPGRIEFHGFGTEATDWNAETYSVGLVDISRNDNEQGLFGANPEVKPPQSLNGMSRRVIRPGESLTIQTDARKWSIGGGWTAGRYRFNVRVDRLRIDEHATASVISDFCELEIVER